MDLRKEIQKLVEESVFIDLELKKAILVYIQDVDDEEIKNILSLIQNINKKKDESLLKVLTSDKKKFEDFKLMIKTLKNERSGIIERESKEEDIVEIVKLEKEINQMH